MNATAAFQSGYPRMRFADLLRVSGRVSYGPAWSPAGRALAARWRSFEEGVRLWLKNNCTWTDLITIRMDESETTDVTKVWIHRQARIAARASSWQEGRSPYDFDLDQSGRRCGGEAGHVDASLGWVVLFRWRAERILENVIDESVPFGIEALWRCPDEIAGRPARPSVANGYTKESTMSRLSSIGAAHLRKAPQRVDSTILAICRLAQVVAYLGGRKAQAPVNFIERVQPDRLECALR